MTRGSSTNGLSEEARAGLPFRKTVTAISETIAGRMVTTLGVGVALIVVALGVLAALPAVRGNRPAGTHYVSPQGKRMNPGTKEGPLSLGEANSSGRPGDTFILEDGNYDVPIAPAGSGESGKPITYKAAHPGQARFDDMQDAIVLTDRAFIHVEGIGSKNVQRWVRSDQDAHHITIDGCRFGDAQGWESCRFRRAGDRITVRNSVFRGGTDLVSIGQGKNHLIENNVFDTAEHTCLVLLGIERSIVRGNTFVNPKMKLIEVFSRRYEPDKGRPSEHVFIEDNDLEYSGDYKKAGSSSVAMTLTGKHIVARRNLVRNCQAGFFWFQQEPGSESGQNWGNRVYNNVFYGNGHGEGFKYNGLAMIFCGLGNELYGDNIAVNNVVFNNRHADCRWFRGFESTIQIGFHAGTGPEHVRLLNNGIAFRTGGEKVIATACANRPRRSYTLREYEAAFPEHASGNIGVDPGFVNAEQGDFHLRRGSPCIDAGRPLTTTKTGGSGEVLMVADASYFCDGFGLVEPDVLRVGDQRVKAVKVDYEANTIALDHRISWEAGALVSLDYKGAAPDIGAFEFSQQAAPGTTSRVTADSNRD